MTLTFDPMTHHPHQQTLCLWRRHTTMSHNPNYLDFVLHLWRRHTPMSQVSVSHPISAAHFRRDII